MKVKLFLHLTVNREFDVYWTVHGSLGGGMWVYGLDWPGPG